MRITVKDARTKRGYSIQKMATLMNMSITSYHFKENNPGRFRIDEAYKFAEVVDMEFKDIIFYAQ